jgi:hypothetical protein
MLRLKGRNLRSAFPVFLFQNLLGPPRRSHHRPCPNSERRRTLKRKSRTTSSLIKGPGLSIRTVHDWSRVKLGAFRVRESAKIRDFLQSRTQDMLGVWLGGGHPRRHRRSMAAQGHPRRHSGAKVPTSDRGGDGLSKSRPTMHTSVFRYGRDYGQTHSVHSPLRTRKRSCYRWTIVCHCTYTLTLNLLVQLTKCFRHPRLGASQGWKLR